MGYRTLFLTLGELKVADILLADPPKGDLQTLRDYGAVRSSLQLRQAARDLNKLNEKGLDLGILQVVPTPDGPQPILLQWDDMLDPVNEIAARVTDRRVKLAVDEAPTEMLEKLEAYRVMLVEYLGERECAISKEGLETLNELIGKKDWTKQTIRDPQTRMVKVVDALVSMAQSDIFCSLATKVHVAVTEPEEG